MDKWIQKAHLHKGKLHHELGIPIGEKIPEKELQDILHADPGEVIHEHLDHHMKNIHVTPHLKKEAQLAENLRHLHH